MMQLPRRRLFACLAILMAAAASTAIAQSPAPPGDVAAGRRAFVDYGCYYCHGTVGQGSLPTIGPRVARVPRSFDSFRNYVRRPAGRMSSYPPAVIDDPALVNIYAYLRSLPEPASLPALLNELRKR